MLGSLYNRLKESESRQKDSYESHSYRESPDLSPLDLKGHPCNRNQGSHQEGTEVGDCCVWKEDWKLCCVEHKWSHGEHDQKVDSNLFSGVRGCPSPVPSECADSVYTHQVHSRLE